MMMMMMMMNHDDDVSAPNALESEKTVSEKKHPKISAIFFAYFFDFFRFIFCAIVCSKSVLENQLYLLTCAWAKMPVVCQSKALAPSPLLFFGAHY